MTDRLQQLLTLFRPHARAADPWPIHWMGGGDAGPDYCLPCCEQAVAEACASGEYPDAIVDGGWDDCREQEGPAYCEGCGRLLGYWLNRYGLDDEIAHWEQDGDPGPLTPDQAYEVEAILDAALNFGDAGQIDAAIAIGEQMVRLLPASVETMAGVTKEACHDA